MSGLFEKDHISYCIIYRRDFIFTHWSSPYRPLIAISYCNSDPSFIFFKAITFYKTLSLNIFLDGPHENSITNQPEIALVHVKDSILIISRLSTFSFLAQCSVLVYQLINLRSIKSWTRSREESLSESRLVLSSTKKSSRCNVPQTKSLSDLCVPFAVLSHTQLVQL